MTTSWWVWAVTFGLVGAVLALDLGVFHRRGRPVAVGEALTWSGVWIGLGCAFGAVIWVWQGPVAGGQYFAGYVLEKALSVDNLFVFTVLLAALAVPSHLQHRLLTWGVLGALALRAAVIVAGVALIDVFQWTIVAMGGLLVVTGARLFRSGDGAAAVPKTSRMAAWVGRVVPLSPSYSGSRFFVRDGGRLLATPLLLALLALETTDLLFAVDSIPAVLAVTTDTFLVVTSNAFAVLGMRSLYFVLSGMAGRFRHLRPGLAVILVLTGAKMLASHVVEVPVSVSLPVIAGVLGAAVVSSVVTDRTSVQPSADQVP